MLDEIGDLLLHELCLIGFLNRLCICAKIELDDWLIMQGVVATDTVHLVLVAIEHAGMVENILDMVYKWCWLLKFYNLIH